MAYPTEQDLENASTDAQTLGNFVNGAAGASNVNRVGNDVQNLATIINLMMAAATAVASMKVYATKTDMDAVTPTVFPGYAQVANDSDTGNNGYWIYPSGATAWSKATFQPVSSAAVDALTEQVSTVTGYLGSDSYVEASHEFTDKYGFVIAYLLTNGVMQLSGVQLDSIQLNGDTYSITRSGDGIEITDPHGYIIAAITAFGAHIYGLDIAWVPDADEISLVDKHGFYVFYAGPHGIVSGALISAPDTPASLAVSELPYLEFTAGSQIRTDVMHVQVYGQSLSRGDHTITPISTTQPYFNVMPASGVLVRSGDPEYAFTDFVPMIEQAFTDTSTGASGQEAETPTSGMLNEIVRRMVLLGANAADWVFLGHSGGQGGQIVQNLAQGGSTHRFEQMIKLITDAKSLADSKGKTYSLWAMNWEQGETDYTSGSNDKTAWAYIQREMTAMWDPFKRQVMQITGQLFSPLLVTYQVANHRQAGHDAMPIAMAHWQASRQRDDIVLGAPCYIFPTGSDYLHLTPEGSWLMGVYMGRALFHTMCANAGKWRPLEPVSVDWADDHIDIRYHVPCKPLAIDDALATTYANAGFIIRNSDETVADIISGVSVLDSETLRITLSSAAAVDAYLTYARGQSGDPAHSGPASGARGNVRDSHGVYDQVTSPLGNTFSLHNASVMFQYSRKLGFN